MSRDERTRKAMDRSAAGKAERLAAVMVTPNGGVAQRCQARKRNGTQCGAPARRGKRVCVRHGGGSAARVESGERRPTGRPPIHGLYSKAGRRKIAEILTDLEAVQLDLDDSDGEMRVLRATLTYLLGQADIHEEGSHRVRAIHAILEAAAAQQDLSAAEAVSIGRTLSEANRLLGRMESWARTLVDTARYIVRASKERADTRAKAADRRALETLTKFVHVVRNILHDMLDEHHLDALEARLVREVFIPNGMEMPDRSDSLTA